MIGTVIIFAFYNKECNFKMLKWTMHKHDQLKTPMMVMTSYKIQ